MENRSTDFFKIFEVLDKYKVEYIVIGGISAVLNGAPITTFDLDIVHHRDPNNIEKLMQALEELNASYRTRRDIIIKPDALSLEGHGHHLLLTDVGSLDLLGTFGEGQDYNDLLAESHVIEVEDILIRVQSLESLIKLKELIGRDKDKAVIPILRQALKENSKK